MKPQSLLSRHTLFKAAKKACLAYPRDAEAAHRVFLNTLAVYGVRTHRLPELILWIIQGALDRSLGDATRAAWRIQADLGSMNQWLHLGHDRNDDPSLAHAA